MFGRVLWRLMWASRARLAVALLALVSGAAIVSAFVSLELDMDGKLAQQFRSLGPNIVVSAPRLLEAVGDASLLPESVWQQAQAVGSVHIVAAAPFLYLIAKAQEPASGQMRQVVAAGTLLAPLEQMNSSWKLEGRQASGPGACLVGRNVARQFHLEPGSRFELGYADRTIPLEVAAIITAGSAEDDQVFFPLARAQQLAGTADKISLIELSAVGRPQELDQLLARLRGSLSGVDVRPISQLTAGAAYLLRRVHLLVFATIVMILVLTILGVLATMAALAAERRADVGLMKAIGGPMPRLLRFFLAEVGILGGLGGLLGYPMGVVLSWWVGQRVFGVHIAIRPEVFPLTVALMLGAALAGAFPLRRLGRVQPAVILRGK